MSRQQQTIHAAVLHGIGQAPRYERFPAPVPGEGQAVVSVTAAALKPSDRLMANGVHYAPTRSPRSSATCGARPREAVFAALARPDLQAANGPQRIRYIQVGITAGEMATLPAITLRIAPVQLFGRRIVFVP